jgi:large subunit ribosomal protein L1
MKFSDILLEIKNNRKLRKFDESIDAEFSLNMRKNQEKEIVRGICRFPHPFGEEKKIIVFSNDEKSYSTYLKLGAVKAGGEELIESILSSQTIDFDIALATPTIMVKLAKISKLLGPKGLMPNPKNGTVTENISDAITLMKSGSQNFKSLPGGIIKMRIAKISQADEEITANYIAAVEAILIESRKLGISSFKRVIIKSTMGKPHLVDM